MSTHKKAYIIGIAGKATAPIAQMLVSQGWQVEGSDQNCYPPASTYLDSLGVVYRTPYAAKNITFDPDMVMIGGNALIVNKENPEYLLAKERGYRIVSYPEVLKECVVKEQSIVTVGTYGKTTTSAILAWILTVAGWKPGYMVGSTPLNFSSAVHAGEGEWSVLEGDEHPTLGFDMRPKFVHYAPKYVLLTACEWDHVNVYPTEESYIQVYRDLVTSLPSDGLLVACVQGAHVAEVIADASCTVITYGVGVPADVSVSDIQVSGKWTTFTVNGLFIHSPLIGLHNVQNVAGCVTLAQQIGVPDTSIVEALKTFKGIGKRLEVKALHKGIMVIDDFAHSAVKVRETLRALRDYYPSHRIVCVFDPSSGSLREPQSLAWYPGCFDAADRVIVTQIPRTKGVTGERVTGVQIAESIAQTQPDVRYEPDDDAVLSLLKTETQQDTIIIFCSTTDLRGMLGRFCEALPAEA